MKGRVGNKKDGRGVKIRGKRDEGKWEIRRMLEVWKIRGNRDEGKSGKKEGW